jgi:hypothetical protein
VTIDLSAIATPQELRDQIGELSADDENMASVLLTTMTRVVERRIGVAPGMLKPQTALTFTFPAYGGSRLYLRDERGLQYFLRAITADSLKIDTDGDGSYDDYLLDSADAWVRLYPVNAASFSEPYTAIDLTTATGVTITSWPEREAAVQIVGTWGVANGSAIQNTIKERVIGLTRELIDVLHAGYALSESGLDGAIETRPAARSLMWLIEREFSYRRPMFG